MIKYIVTSILALSLTSCASIVSKSSYSVSINSSPNQAKFTIKNKNGIAIHSGTTPSFVTLSSGDGYFKKANYIIQYEKSGYNPKEQQLIPELNGWYWGNILLGGLIGMLIVDPLTGARDC